MDMSRFYDPAKIAADEAVKYDEAQKFLQAKNSYISAVEYIVEGMKFDKLATRKQQYQERAMTYLDRIEQLKKILDQGNDPKMAGSSSGGTATANKGENTNTDDAEKDKMKGALAGAIISEKPNVKWDDVAGLEGAKEALKEAVILPAKFPQLFVGNRKPWKGILLYGPPGTGKSYLAKAVATEADGCFFAVSASDLISKWQGDSEKLVRNLFELARDKKSAIIFIDEIDSMCGSRDQGTGNDSTRRVLTEFLVQMQGVGKANDNVLVLGATNTPWDIDSAMRRRFEKPIYIPLPDKIARARMFKIHLGSTPHTLQDADFTYLGERTEGMSGSDVGTMVREAIMEPLRKCRTAKYFVQRKDNKLMPVMQDPPCSYCVPDLASKPAPHKVVCRNCGCMRADLLELNGNDLYVPEVSLEDFETVMRVTHGSVGANELKRYEQWTKEFGSEGS